MAFSSDIEKAFLQVHLDIEEGDFTRFIWLPNPTNTNSPFVTFRFKVVLFGATCSPFMLSATPTYHLMQSNTIVSLDLLQNFYVDNVVSGCQSEMESPNYFTSSRSILGSASFNLHSWASNSESQLENATLLRRIILLKCLVCGGILILISSIHHPNLMSVPLLLLVLSEKF